MKNKDNLAGMGPGNPREPNYKRTTREPELEKMWRERGQRRWPLLALKVEEGATAKNTRGYWRQEKEREGILPAHSGGNTILATIWPQPISHFHCTKHKTKVNSVLTF